MHDLLLIALRMAEVVIQDRLSRIKQSATFEERYDLIQEANRLMDEAHRLKEHKALCVDDLVTFMNQAEAFYRRADALLEVQSQRFADFPLGSGYRG